MLGNKRILKEPLAGKPKWCPLKMELCGGGKEDVDLPIGTEWIVVSVEDDNEYCHIKIASGLDGSKTGAPMKISSLGEYFEL